VEVMAARLRPLTPLALVTGTSSGMGLATARAFAESGAATVLARRHPLHHLVMPRSPQETAGLMGLAEPEDSWVSFTSGDARPAGSSSPCKTRTG
jgi:NAD(P)-dependent dehydrogenase (short-subunit alcohol dehydrogenase family)